MQLRFETGSLHFIAATSMYFGSGIEKLFSTGTLVFLIVVVFLAAWKVFDIIAFVFNNITIVWGN